MDESTLLLYFEGALSDDECRQVEEWADSAPENRKQLEQCYYTIELDKRVCNYEQADVERALDNFRLKLDEDERLAEVSKKVRR